MCIRDRYQYSLSLLYLKAVKDILANVQVDIKNSLSNGLYTEIKTIKPLTEKNVKDIEKRMKRLVYEDIPFVKQVVSRDEAFDILVEDGLIEKTRLLNESLNLKQVKFYSLGLSLIHILCGDMNVAHEEIDLKNPKTNRGNAGFSDEERNKMTELLEAGFVDTFRYKYPDRAGIYSWWSYRFNARKNNAGWRIDYFIVSDRLKNKIKDAKIHTEVLGSDHCPVELEIDL